MPESEGKGYKDPFNQGTIGSEEGRDLMNPAPQTIETKPYSSTETRDQECHSAVYTLKESGVTVSMRNYNDFAPRVAPMPRAIGEDLYLEGPGKNAADPRMTDTDVTIGPRPEQAPDKADLFGANRDGVLKK